MSLGKFPNEITIQFFLKHVAFYLMCVHLSFLIEQPAAVGFLFLSLLFLSPSLPPPTPPTP